MAAEYVAAASASLERRCGPLPGRHATPNRASVAAGGNPSTHRNPGSALLTGPRLRTQSCKALLRRAFRLQARTDRAPHSVDPGLANVPHFCCGICAPTLWWLLAAR